MTQSKIEALAELYYEMRRNILDKRLVFGEGSPNACLAIIGEAPGREEEKAGRPFVGRAGQLLDQLLAEVSLQRAEIWLTNLIKWRPTRGSANRSPSQSEIRSELHWIQRELDIIRPRVVLCLGNSATRALIDKNFNLSRERGQWHQGSGGSFIMATFHPAYLLRETTDNGLRQQVLEDLQQAKAKCLE